MPDRSAAESSAPASPLPPSQTCNDCRFALFADYGWSNWTTEGTEFFCMVGAHPEDGFDRWYGEDKRLWFAAECPRFERGDCVEMDVDRDNENDLTDDQRDLYLAWQLGPKGSE